MKKDKEVNLDEIDASFVISSFKNKERRNNPSSVPRALVPEREKDKKEIETDEQPVDTQPKAPIEESKRKRNKIPDYESLFIHEVGITARSGKSVYIRKGHHEKIMKIIQVIGKNQISLFSYIDNVLSHHLASYQDEITELYNKNNEGIF